MYYVLRNDFNNLYNKKKFLLLVSFLIFLFYSLYIKSSNIDNGAIYYYLGIKFDIRYFAVLLLYIFNIILYAYINISLYLKDFNFGYDYMFMRINFSKWNKYKLCSILICTTILKILQFILFIVFFLKELNFYSLLVLFSNIIWIYLISILIIEIYIDKGRKLLNSLILIIYFIGIHYFYLNIVYWASFVLISIINLYIFSNRKYSSLRIGGSI